MWRDANNEERAREVLHETRCPLCPNVISDAPYHIIRTQSIVKHLAEITDATVVETPAGLIILCHVRCYENAKLIAGGD